MIRLIRRYWISIGISVVILILCLMNTEPMPSVPMTDFDKLVHFLMIAGLSGIIFFENSNYLRKKVSGVRVFFGSFLFPVLFSGAIELIQEYLSPYRSGDWMDFLWDGVGALVGVLICLLINSKLKR